MPLEIRGAHFLIRSAQLVLRIGADMPDASAWRSTLLAGSAVLFIFVCTSRLSRTAWMDNIKTWTGLSARKSQSE